MSRKKILIIVVIVGVVGLISTLLIINANWGAYESDVQKSDLTDSIEYSNNEEVGPPSLDQLEGKYSVTKKTGAAEILFHTDGLKSTKGGFEEFSINFNVPDDYKKSTLEVIIQTRSINTDNKTRDGHLMEEGFFEADKYPEITYKSDAIALGDTSYIAKGKLTLNGTTKDLDVPFKHLGNGEIDNVPFEAFEGAFQIDRTAYGQAEETGVGNIVKINFYCELQQVK